MSRSTRIALLGAVVLAGSAVAWAQYPSELVGFNGPPIDDPATSQEMFRQPQFSGSTARYIVPNETGYENNAAFRASGLQTEGAAAMQVFFNWVDPYDPNAWVRLSTFNGPQRPNPSLHTRGRVRFKIVNRSELFFGEIGVCIGIRETGVVVPQLANGGTAGPIEWVGVSGVIPDPNNPAQALAPIPAITLPPSPNPYQLEWNLATGQVRVGNGPWRGGIAAFTGDGVLNAPNNRGTLEHIAITSTTDGAVLIDFAIDELQFEAPEPDPVLPPRVVWPIIAGDTEVTVTDLMATVNQVALYVNGGHLQTVNVSSPDDVVFTIAPAVTGDVYTARQHDSVTGNWSDYSEPVVVLPEPPPYTFSLLIDQGGTGSCDYTTGGWEWVGATGPVTNWAPIGQPLFTSDGLWQTIDVPLDDDDLVWPSYGGNGELGPSPNGVYTIDSVWFTLTEGTSPGPWVVFIDAVQWIDEYGQVGGTLLDMEDGVNRLSRPRGQSPDELGLISSQLSTITAYDGTTSHRLVWQCNGTPPEAIGMLQRIGYNCGTSALIPDTATAIRFHLLLRSQSTNPVPLPEVVGPIVVGTQHTVRVLNDAAATSVQLYLNGEPYGLPRPPTGGYTDFPNLPLTPGDSVSATQTLPAGESDLAYPRVVQAVPPAPTVVAPIYPGATSVTVTDLLTVPYATASYVLVYKDGQFVGSANAGQQTVTVPVVIGGPLQSGQAITATQYVNGVESGHSAAVYVGVPAPTIHRAPAAGDSVVRVIEVHPQATLVTVSVNNGAATFTANPGGNTWVDVPVSGLVTGDIVTAWMTVGGNPSAESAPETVTTNVTTPIFVCDTFESYASQAEMNAVWTQAGSTPVQLATDMNSTCEEGATQSAYTPPGTAWMYRVIPQTTPSLTQPVVLNVNMYDPVGADPDGLVVQWVEINYLGGTGPFYLTHIGMLGWADVEPEWYDFRAVGLGGPNWIDLNEHEAPLRSVGWHNFTVVHKGTLIDVYVDGKLCKKNLALSAAPVFARADLGGGYATATGVWVDDFCLEVGPVRFGCVAGEEELPGDVDGDGDVDLADLAALLAAYGTSSGQPGYNPDADFDGDGDVDLTDLATLLSNYGTGG